MRGWAAPTWGGRARALAGARIGFAVLTPTAIERYSPDGTLLARDPVPPGTVSKLTMSTYGLVYRVGRSIRVRGRGEVARAVAMPIGLSIEGRRIAWAENVNGRGRIRALTLR